MITKRSPNYQENCQYLDILLLIELMIYRMNKLKVLIYLENKNMKITVDYYIKGKSDKKLMQICHLKLNEEDIINLVREKLTAPIYYNMEDENGDGDYVFSDISIAEINGLS
jgi:hypothetical protein